MPVVDLRLKLDIPAVKKRSELCIIIVEIDIESKLFLMGILADLAPSPLLIDLDPGTFEPRSCHGMNDRSIIVLDLESMLSDGEFASINFLVKIIASIAEKTNSGNRGVVSEIGFLENFRTSGEFIH